MRRPDRRYQSYKRVAGALVIAMARRRAQQTHYQRSNGEAATLELWIRDWSPRHCGIHCMTMEVTLAFEASGMTRTTPGACCALQTPMMVSNHLHPIGLTWIDPTTVARVLHRNSHSFILAHYILPLLITVTAFSSVSVVHACTSRKVIKWRWVGGRALPVRSDIPS